LATGGIVVKVFSPKFESFCNKQEHLSLASLSSLVKCLQVRPGAHHKVEHLKVTSYG